MVLHPCMCTAFDDVLPGERWWRAQVLLLRSSLLPARGQYDTFRGDGVQRDGMQEGKRTGPTDALCEFTNMWIKEKTTDQDGLLKKSATQMQADVILSKYRRQRKPRAAL
jgi:hypothetical protein